MSHCLFELCQLEYKLLVKKLTILTTCANHPIIPTRPAGLVREKCRRNRKVFRFAGYKRFTSLALFEGPKLLPIAYIRLD